MKVSSKIDRMPVDALPILRDLPGHAAENVRRQMRHFDPRQNQKACVVSDEADVAPPRFARSSRCTGRGCPDDAAPNSTPDRRSAGPAPTPDTSGARPPAARSQVVMLLHQAVEQRLVGRAPHLLNLDRTQRAERHFQRRRVDQHGFRPRTRRAGAGPGSGGEPAATRSRRPAGASAAGRGKPCRATRRWPVSTPGLAQLPRQLPTAAVRVLRDELSDEDDLLAVDGLPR